MFDLGSVSFECPLNIGDLVRLNGGGLKYMVVDIDVDGSVTIARYSDDRTIEEFKAPAACFTRFHVLD